MAIPVVPASQTLAAVQKQLSVPGVFALELEVFHVADFFGRWLRLTRDPQSRSPYGELASPQVSRDLQALGVEVGDQVLVARIPSSAREVKVRTVSPLTAENQHLAGRRIRDPFIEQLALTA
jgi:hypothetical protein